MKFSIGDRVYIKWTKDKPFGRIIPGTPKEEWGYVVDIIKDLPQPYIVNVDKKRDKRLEYYYHESDLSFNTHNSDLLEELISDEN